VNTCQTSDQESDSSNWRDITVAPFRGRQRIDGMKAVITKGFGHLRR
jgi:hypothetical protein